MPGVCIDVYWQVNLFLEIFGLVRLICSPLRVFLSTITFEKVFLRMLRLQLYEKNCCCLTRWWSSNWCNVVTNSI